MLKDAVEDPLNVPLEADAGNVITLLKLSKRLDISKLPLVCKNVFDTVKLLPSVTKPEEVLLIDKLYSDSVVANVSEPKLPVPVILKLEAPPPRRVPTPVMLPLIVHVNIFEVLSLRLTPEAIFKIPEIPVLVLLDKDFCPLPLRIKFE